MKSAGQWQRRSRPNRHPASLPAGNITLAPKKLIRTRRASEGSASEPSLARRVSMCKDAKLSCRGNNPEVTDGDRTTTASNSNRSNTLGRCPEPGLMRAHSNSNNRSNNKSIIGRYLDKARAGGFISPPEARDGLSGFRTRPRTSVTSTEASNGEEVLNRPRSFRRLSLPGQKAHILTNTHHRALVCPFAIPRLSSLERDATSRARSLRFQTK